MCFYFLARKRVRNEKLNLLFQFRDYGDSSFNLAIKRIFKLYVRLILEFCVGIRYAFLLVYDFRCWFYTLDY